MDNICLLAPGHHTHAEMWSTLYKATGKSEANAFFEIETMTLAILGFEIDTIEHMSSKCTKVDMVWIEEARTFFSIDKEDVETL